MLSYRHAFHAGNAADVLKHSVLIQCLDYMGQKEKAYTFIDTHSGAALYHLDEGYAAQNQEWLSGTGKVIDHADEKNEERLLNRYRDIIAPFWRSSKSYPGSSLIASRIMRPQDKAFCYELHPRDFELLNVQLEHNRRFKIIKADGPKGFVSLLPPSSRRGCILIDPSYEIKSDYIDLQIYIAAALKRFSTGMYIVWYPLLARQDAEDFPVSLMNLYAGNRCRIEVQFLETSPVDRGMFGCGLVIYNPPWVLRTILENDMPALAELLNADWRFDWEESSMLCNF